MFSDKPKFLFHFYKLFTYLQVKNLKHIMPKFDAKLFLHRFPSWVGVTRECNYLKIKISWKTYYLKLSDFNLENDLINYPVSHQL